MENIVMTGFFRIWAIECDMWFFATDSKQHLQNGKEKLLKDSWKYMVSQQVLVEISNLREIRIWNFFVKIIRQIEGRSILVT